MLGAAFGRLLLIHHSAGFVILPNLSVSVFGNCAAFSFSSLTRVMLSARIMLSGMSA